MRYSYDAHAVELGRGRLYGQIGLRSICKRQAHDPNSRRRNVDTLSPSERSALMSKVRSTNTTPERRVRSIAHRLGLRFRLAHPGLPGKPDFVLPKHRLAVFVHGCFWHRHSGCKRASIPGTRTEFWLAKFQANVERDARLIRALRELGWRSLVIWECELRDPEVVRRRLQDAARPSSSQLGES